MNTRGLYWKIPLVAGVSWIFVAIYQSVTTPPPGRAINDQGRDHVAQSEVDKTVYNSNPPVSGPHLETWVKPGVYQEEKNKGELIHSLEHGYIEIFYACETGAGDSKTVRQENLSTQTGVKQATGGAINSSLDCKTLVKNLTDLANKKKLFKLIVVPNHTITSPIVLAAWDHIDELKEYDEKRITTFIDYYRDHGPEQTME